MSTTNSNEPEVKKDDGGVKEARRGLMKVMIDHFSSTPLQEEEYEEVDELMLKKKLEEHRQQSLTQPERDYLNYLLQTGDTNSMQTASERLQDERLFPKNLEDSSDSGSVGAAAAAAATEDDDSVDEHNDNEIDNHNHHPEKRQYRRNSLIQQQLFRLHETKDVPPSEVLQRMNSARALLLQEQNSILADDTSTSVDSSMRLRSMTPTSASDHDRAIDASLRLRSMSPTVPASHILVNSEEDSLLKIRPTTPSILEKQEEADEGEKCNDVGTGEEKKEAAESATAAVPADEIAVENEDNNDWADYDNDTWNPFKDISSWLDGGQGIEVTDSGVPISRPEDFTRPMPFRILGTSADDVSCYPHVLSPPLMESLLAFVPEINGESDLQSPSASQDVMTDAAEGEHPAQQLLSPSLNFWLKYSLVRDGANLWTLLRQVRASTHCFLAIETDQGHVFGAFTSQPWRLAKGWYGSKETFLWKMRRPRIQAAGKSIVQQVCQESEIQVFPYRTGNAAVQYCSKKCLMLGQGEIIPSPTYHNDPNKSKTGRIGKHYGYALFLSSDLTKGTTSTSETFGNPCLTDSEQRGDRFNVANIEVWTLTPHGTVAEAEQSELSTLFLDGGRDGKRLNLINIISGGPI